MRYVYRKLFKQNSCPVHISQMYDYVFNEEEGMKKREENKKKKTRREKVLPFFQSPSENRTWILEFACYPRPLIKIKSTINFTLMKKISIFSAIVPNQQTIISPSLFTTM